MGSTCTNCLSNDRQNSKSEMSLTENQDGTLEGSHGNTPSQRSIQRMERRNLLKTPEKANKLRKKMLSSGETNQLVSKEVRNYDTSPVVQYSESKNGLNLKARATTSTAPISIGVSRADIARESIERSANTSSLLANQVNNPQEVSRFSTWLKTPSKNPAQDFDINYWKKPISERLSIKLTDFLAKIPPESVKTIAMSENSLFRGEVYLDKPCGPGVLIRMPKKEYFLGVFGPGMAPLSPEYKLEYFCLNDQIQYLGHFNSFLEFDRFGAWRNDVTGEIYEGEFEKGKFHGQGSYLASQVGTGSGAVVSNEAARSALTNLGCPENRFYQIECAPEHFIGKFSNGEMTDDIMLVDKWGTVLMSPAQKPKQLHLLSKM